MESADFNGFFFPSTTGYVIFSTLPQVGLFDYLFRYIYGSRAKDAEGEDQSIVEVDLESPENAGLRGRHIFPLE